MSRCPLPALLWIAAICCCRRLCFPSCSAAAAAFHVAVSPRNSCWRRQHQKQRGARPCCRGRAPRFGAASFLRSTNAAAAAGGGASDDGSHGATTTAATTVAAAASSSPSSSSSLDRPPRVGDVVSILCKLVPEGSFVPEPLIDGVVLQHECTSKKTKNDKDGESGGSSTSSSSSSSWAESAAPVPLTFVLGKGNYLPGLHELILTRLHAVGDRVSGVPLDAGYGSRNPDLVAEIAFDSLPKGEGGIDPSTIRVGTQLRLSNGLVCAVTLVTPNASFVIDGNHPLAGASYVADVELVRVEEGPDMAPYADDDDDDETTCGSKSRYRVATFALGCFWGGELEYMREHGVVGTRVGYTQGSVKDPTYEQVCSGTTGHAEAVAVAYDPDVVSYGRLVHLAMDRLGDSKYLKNQVGNDRGTQYRHGVYYHNRDQKNVAERIVASFGEDCRTECLPAKVFYEAEEYHQQYLLKGGQSARKGDQSVIRCYG